mgnify:CR=1 FL=1
MTISILLAQQIAQLFLMIFMGFLIVKAGLLKDEDSKVLSKIVLYLIIPCVILNAFSGRLHAGNGAGAAGCVCGFASDAGCASFCGFSSWTGVSFGCG